MDHMEVEIKEEPADDDLQLQAGDATWQIVEEWSDGSAAQLSSTQENQSKQDQEGNTASELSEMSAQSVLTEQPMLFEMNSTSEENVSFVPTSEQESLNRAFKETFSEASEDKQGKQPTPVFLLMPTQDGIMYCSTEGPQSNLAYVTGTPNEPTTFTDPLKTDSAQAFEGYARHDFSGKGSSSSSVENKKIGALDEKAKMQLQKLAPVVKLVKLQTTNLHSLGALSAQSLPKAASENSGTKVTPEGKTPSYPILQQVLKEPLSETEKPKPQEYGREFYLQLPNTRKKVKIVAEAVESTDEPAKPSTSQDPKKKYCFVVDSIEGEEDEFVNVKDLNMESITCPTDVKTVKSDQGSNPHKQTTVSSQRSNLQKHTTMSSQGSNLEKETLRSGHGSDLQEKTFKFHTVTFPDHPKQTSKKGRRSDHQKQTARSGYKSDPKKQKKSRGDETDNCDADKDLWTALKSTSGLNLEEPVNDGGEPAASMSFLRVLNNMLCAKLDQSSTRRNLRASIPDSDSHTTADDLVVLDNAAEKTSAPTQEGTSTSTGTEKGQNQGKVLTEMANFYGLSRGLVFESCDCGALSKKDIEERELWQGVWRFGRLLYRLPNIGIVRFLGSNIFTFEKGGLLYMNIGELFWRALLPRRLSEFQTIVEFFDEIPDSVPKSQLTRASPRESAFTTQFIGQPYHSDVLITPYALRAIYERLGELHGVEKWQLYSRALFYRQRLGHQCAWSLLVTPPTEQSPRQGVPAAVPKLGQVAMKRLYSVESPAEHGVTTIKTCRELCDGGAGTALEVKGVCPSLSQAMTDLIFHWKLMGIVKPFCTCQLSVKGPMPLEPLTFGDIPLTHITEMKFLDLDGLHCWKRNNGFFVSLFELRLWDLLPPAGDVDFDEILDSAMAAGRKVDVCEMLQGETIFLSHYGYMPEDIKEVEEKKRKERSGEKSEGFHSSSSCSVAIEKPGALNEMTALLNVRFLRKIYEMLSEVDGTYVPHSEGIFYVKYWMHDCPKEIEMLDELEGCSSKFRPKVLYGPKRPHVKSKTESNSDTNTQAVVSKADSHYGTNKSEAEDNTESKVDENKQDRVSETEIDHGVIDQEMGDAAERHEGIKPSSADESSSDLEKATQVVEKMESRRVKRKYEAVKGLEQTESHHRKIKEEVMDETEIPRGKVKRVVMDDTVSPGGKVERVVTDDTEIPGGKVESVVMDDTEIPGGKVERVVMNDTESPGGKAKRAVMDEAESYQVRIKQEVMDEEEEVANLPIMFGPDLIVADTSADNVAEGLDENAVEDSYLVEVNVEEVKELGMEFTASDEMVGSTQTEPAHAQSVIVTVADSDNSWHTEAPEDELTNEQDLIFSMYAYPWSCDCPQNEDSNYPLKSYSIEQCFCSRHKTRVVEPLTVLSQIGQAIIHQTILFTFKTEKMMHFSVAELLAKGLLKPTVTYEYLHSHGNKLWCRQANSFETSFLQHQGVWMPTSNLLTSHLLAQMMISAEFLCFLSYSESGGTRIGLKQSDIFLHQVGHICPNSSSLARRALRSIINIERLMSAWAKSCVMVNRAKDIMRKKVGENSQRHQIKALTEVKHTTQPQPPIPPEKEDTIRMLSTADCFLKLKRFVSTDLMHCPDESKKVQVHGGTEYFVCSPTNRGAEHSKSNMSKLPSDQSENRASREEEPHDSAVFFGAMAPRKSPYTNVNLKGYAYITEDYVSSMVGKRFPEHIIVMAGTLRVWERSFSVLRVNGKLYLSWGECAHKLVGINTVYALAQKLRVFLYKVPHAVLYHLAENYPGLQFGQINNNPWICINSLNAIYCLGIMEPQNLTMFPKTFSLLWDIFVETAQQKVRYRSFVLLPKQGSALPEPTAGPTRKEKKRMKICFI